MAKYDTSKFNKELERIATELKLTIQAINKNDDLSNAGKERRIREAREESLAVRRKLGEDFLADAKQKRDSMTRQKAPKPTHRDLVRQQAAEWEQYPNLYADAVRANAELDILERVLVFQERAEWRDIARNGDDRYFTARLASNDPDELERIQREGLPFLPKEARARMDSAYTSRIQTLKEEQMPPELKEFDEDVMRFNKSLEAFDRDGTYSDYRQRQPEPENETVLEPYEVPERVQVQSNSGEGTGEN